MIRNHPAATKTRALRMRESGVPRYQIAKRLKIGISTVYRWTDPEYNARQLAQSREQKKKYAGTCEECGGPTSGANGPGTAASICGKCKAEQDRVLSDRDVEYALRRYLDDRVGCATIAAELGTHPQTLSRYLTEVLGELRPHQRGSWTRIPVDEASALYEAGWTLQELADRYGVTMNSIQFQFRGRVRIRTPQETKRLRKAKEAAAS